MCIMRKKMKYASINNLKNFDLPFLQGFRFNIFLFTPTLLKSFKEAVISLRHLGKSTLLEENLYLGPIEIILRTLASGMTFKLPVITS